MIAEPQLSIGFLDFLMPNTRFPCAFLKFVISEPKFSFDFLDFMIGDFHWYVFNFADSYVTIGMIMVLIDNIFFEKKREQISA